MGIISIDNTGVLNVAYDAVLPLPNESYVLQSPDTTKWDVVANGTTGDMTETNGSVGTVVQAFFIAPDGSEWELTIDNGGVLSAVPFSSALMFSPVGNDQFKLASGAIAASYLLFTFMTHTTTHAATYKNRTYSQVQPNPIVLNSLGFPTDGIFIQEGTYYTFVLAPAGSPDPPVAPLYTWDDITGGAFINRANPTEFTTPALPAVTISSTTLSVMGDKRKLLLRGRRVQLADVSMLYGTITDIAFNGTVTTATVALDSGTLSSSLTTVSIGLLQSIQSVVPSRSIQNLRTNLNGSLTMAITANFNLLPAGMLVGHAASVIPAGWLLCDGTSYLRASYAALFAAIGTTYGSVDGTHFNVPDLRGRLILPCDNLGGTPAGRVTAASLNGVNAVNLGGAGGGETHILALAELPSHTHTGSGGTSTIGVAGSGVTGEGYNTSAANNSRGTFLSTGSGSPHNAMPPYEALNILIYAQA